MDEDMDPKSGADKGFFVEPSDKEAAMFMKDKRQWIWIIFSLFMCCSIIQTASAWDMIPPSESVRNAADEFKQPWRIEAERKFSEPALVAANHVMSYSLLTFLIALLGALFHLMVKSNHMEQTAKRVRAGMLSFYTRMWLVGRWGFRY